MKELIRPIVRPVMRAWATASEKRSYPGVDVASTSAGNDAIAKLIRASTPTSAGKIGGFELNMIKNYLRNAPADSPKWLSQMHKLHVNAGIFPEDHELAREFCGAYTEALKDIDVLGIWFNLGEAKIAHRFCKSAQIVNYNGLEPFSCDDPWTMELEGKNVLVVHPFRDSIKAQYEKRSLIWAERKLLPDFNLLQIKMPLSNALVPSRFDNWKEQLGDIKKQMDALDYDVALVGAGAYSLLITQHAKLSGRSGIHLGGVTQILFGICGSRWLSSPEATKLFNEHWVRPLPEETPETSKLVENGCYW